MGFWVNQGNFDKFFVAGLFETKQLDNLFIDFNTFINSWRLSSLLLCFDYKPAEFWFKMFSYVHEITKKLLFSHVIYPV